MKKLVLVLLLLASALVTAPAQAQGVLGTGEGETWYFVQDMETQTLTAFTLAGETQVVATGADFTASPRGYRVDAETMLVFEEFEDDTMLPYLLTAEDGLLSFDAPLMTSDYIPIHYSEPYVVMISFLFNMEGQTVYVLDLENRRTIQLAGTVSTVTVRQCCRITDDGRYLRYPAQVTPGEDEAQQIREVDLNDFSERVLYTSPQSDGFVGLLPGANGQYWLERRDRTYTLLNINVLNDEIAMETQPLPTTESSSVRFLEDQLLITDFGCEADCTMQVRALAGGATRTLTAPEYGFAAALYLSETGLTVFADEQYFELREDGIVPLGAYRPRSLAQPTQTTPDGRFLLMIDDPDEPLAFWLRDNETGENALTIPVDEEGRALLAMRTLADGETINLFDLGGTARPAYLFDTVTEELTTINIADYTERARVLWIEPDGRALVLKFPDRDADDAAYAPGMYRLDTETNTLTQLVASERPFPLDGDRLDMLNFR